MKVISTLTTLSLRSEINYMFKNLFSFIVSFIFNLSLKFIRYFCIVSNLLKIYTENLEALVKEIIVKLCQIKMKFLCLFVPIDLCNFSVSFFVVSLINQVFMKMSYFIYLHNFQIFLYNIK